MDPQFAERTTAEMLVSTMAGAVEARRKKDDLEQKRIKSFEAACEFIATHSEDYYEKGIFEKRDEADAFIKAVVKNPEASSRRQKRNNTDQKGIGPQRAITVEYAANIAGLPLHDYGLHYALKHYIESGPPVLDEKGNEVRGEDALKIMAKDFAFFREEMKLATIRQQKFTPVLAAVWAKRAGQEGWVDTIMKELIGLGELCQSILSAGMDSGTKMPFGKREDYSGEPYTSAFADVSQAVLSANPELLAAKQEDKSPEALRQKAVKNKFYLALQNLVSEGPPGPMRSKTPGIGALSQR